MSRATRRKLLAAVFSDLQFWIPVAALVLGSAILAWVSQ